MNQSEIQLAKEKALEDLRKIREELLQRDRNADKKQINTSSKGTSILKLKDSDKKERTKKNKDKSSHKKHKKSDKEKHGHEPRLSLEKNHSSISENESSAPKRSCSPEVAHERDDWMTSSVMLKTFSKNKPLPKKQCTDTYEPGKSSRELNPHWKNGGSGLPAFRKPKDDYEDNDYDHNEKYYSKSYKSTSGGWVKKTKANDTAKNYQEEYASTSTISEEKEMSPELLSDQQMNELGAKIMKAELLNNKELAEELKNKLKSARLLREQSNGNAKDSNKIKSKSHRKPHADATSGGRVRNSTLDDEHDLKKKFEREKSKMTKDSVKTPDEHPRFKEDFDDIFGTSKQEESDNDIQREIRNTARHSKKLDNCDKCFNMDKINKELVVSVGKYVYLALPWHEGLQVNHCLIIPIDHYACSTELDENVWQEISHYRRVLTKLFAKRKQDVLFFETARYLKKRPHMVIQCLPSDGFEMAPFYFKKAIEESEYEWSKNKQLVTLKEKGLRKSIPSGLPYFWVNFGMDFGFAHVIENQENFPMYFAQEIIGGMLTLDMRKWRSPRQEHNIKTKVKNLFDLLKPYDLE